MKMLFSKEIEGLHDDGFDGSNNERHIFMEVFFGSNKGDVRKRCFHGGTADFEAENTKLTSGLLYSNSDNSVVTSQSSTKDSYLEDFCTVNNDSGHVKDSREGLSSKSTEIGCAEEGSTFWENRDGYSADFKRMKWSVDEFTEPGRRSLTNCVLDMGKDLIQLESQEEVPKMPIQDSYHVDQTVRCHLVESSSQGMTTSCYLLEQYKEAERKMSNLVRRIGNEEDENKAISLPVTQHGAVPILLSGGASVADMSLAVICSKESSEESVLLNSDIVAISCRKESMEDQRPRLRRNVHHLFMAAGWCLDKRKRTDRTYMENVYISPKGRVFHELHKSWRSCGESLLDANLQLLQEENEKQWDHIGEFWSDLSDTLMYIEQEMQQMDHYIVLAHHWILLDPFVTVALIDRQLRALKDGIPVQAVRTVLFDQSKRKDVFAAKNSGWVRNHVKALPWNKEGGLNDSLESACEVGDTFVNVDVPINSCQLFAESAPTMASGFVTYEQPCNGSSPVLCEKRQRGRLKALKGVSIYFKDDSDILVETKITDATENQQMEIFRDQINNSNVGPAQQSEFSSVHQDGCLHDIPVTYATANMIIEGTKDVIPWRNNNVILASLVKRSSRWREAGTVEATRGPLRDVSEETGVISNGHSGEMNENGIREPDQVDGLNENFIPFSHTDGASTPPDIWGSHTAFVVQGVKMVMKEVEEDQKINVRGFSELCQMSCEDDDFKSSSAGLNSHDGEKMKGNLNKQEVDMGNGSDHGHISSMPCNLVESLNNANVSTRESAFAQLRSSLKSSSPDYAMVDFEPSKSYDIKQTQNIYTHETDQCAEQEKLIPCLNLKDNKMDVLKKVTDDGMLETLSHIRHNGDLVTRSCGYSAMQQQKLSLSADDEISHGTIKYYKKEVLAQNSKLETRKDVSVYHATRFVHQRSSSLEDLCDGNVGSSLNKEENISPEREMASEGLQLSGYADALGGWNSEISNIEMEQTSAGVKSSKSKKSPKRSRKISEIKGANLYGKQKVLDSSTSHIGESQNLQDGKTHCQSRKFQRGCLSNDETCNKSLSPGSSQCKVAKQSKFKKFHDQCTSSNGLVLPDHAGISSDDPNSVNNTIECALQSSNGSVEPPCRKIIKSKKSKYHKKGRKQLSECLIDDDDLLIAAIIINKDFSSNNRKSDLRTHKKNPVRKLESQKGSCRLLPRSPGKGGKNHVDGKWSSSGARTVLSWLIDVGVVSLHDVIQYRSPKDNTVVKDGWITRDGIHCNCCNEVLSVSGFKIHAGFKLYRPCLNLFMESGKSFTLCQLEAWSAEYRARRGGKQAVEVDEVDQNDDTCGLCGDGGELICCDNCPSTFHQECLSAKEVPEGDWFCPNCTCWICGNLVSDNEASSSSITLKCSQCEHKYHGACLRESAAMGVVSDTWFCGTNCQEIYWGLRSRVGISNHIADGFSWIVLKCIDGDQKIPSAQRFALMAECNSKLAVALTIMEECFLPMIDPRTGIDMIPHVLYNWSSNFARLNYEGFYTIVLEKGDELISVASIRVHGVTVAEMPLIATCSEHRRQGMCRRLMNAIEETLKSFKVERLVVAAIPSLVETWTLGFGFKPMEDRERELLNNVNLMMFPGTILLRKSLYEVEVTDSKQGTNYMSPTCPNEAPVLPPSCPDGALESGVCRDKNDFEVSVQQSDSNCCTLEVDLEAAPALELENLQLGEEQECELHKNMYSSSSKDPVSNLEGTKNTTTDVECCSPREETLDLCDGSWFPSTKQ